MLAFEIKHLSKNYPNFQLKDVSFQLEQGYIMGFIGANGAGKTTTIKAMLNLINTDDGDIHILGQSNKENELAIKQKVGYTLGGAAYYTRSKMKDLTKVTKSFYTNWDDDVYKRYLEKFELDENKRISELSEGMKVKYGLAIALSHGAKLLILDEPTSGLDPAARDHLLELFQSLVETEEISILFSTHITSDLEKCADYITFIHQGQIIYSSDKDDFIDQFSLIHGPVDQLATHQAILIGHKETSFGFSGLVYKRNLQSGSVVEQTRPSLEEIMVYFSRGESTHA